MSSSFAKNAIVLGLLSAIGPFAIDMYLPALPAIAADLHASTAATQMTLMVFFRGVWRLPDCLWAGLGHGWPQAATLFRDRDLCVGQHRLRSGAEHRVADFFSASSRVSARPP